VNGYVVTEVTKMMQCSVYMNIHIHIQEPHIARLLEMACNSPLFLLSYYIIYLLWLEFMINASLSMLWTPVKF